MGRSKNDILIIEDSVAIALLLKDFLKKLGYENVTMSDTGKSGIQAFSDLETAGKRPIVLLDFHLPDMNANEVMASIFNIRPDAKIILETADSKSDEQIKNALRGGAYLYIEKPIRYENLKSIFETLEKEQSIIEETSSGDLERILLHLKSSSRISFARLAEYAKAENELLEKYLLQLESEKKIMKISEIKEVSCTQCGSIRILPNFFCPACKSTNFVQGKLIEHFKCGNVSVEDSYKENKCPKCKKEIKILGVDYKSMDNYYMCNDCGDKFPDPSQDYICVKCSNRFPLEKAKWVTSTGYKLTNL
ncbi:MAG TPA: response regulator [Candidatus Nitrosotalea sp.]|nr:response regulator [Candidatus Nitrosotalea sp.]